MKTYNYIVKIEWTGKMSGKDEDEVKDKIRESMKDEYGIEPDDDEIILTK